MTEEVENIFDKPQAVLCFDQSSTNTGFCLSLRYEQTSVWRPVRFGVFKQKGICREYLVSGEVNKEKASDLFGGGPRENGFLMGYIASQFIAVCQKLYDLRAVYCEDIVPVFRGGQTNDDAINALMAVTNVIGYETYVRNLAFDCINPSTIKAWSANDGHATKSQMVEAAKSYIEGDGFVDFGRDHNIADAICLSQFVIETILQE